MTQRTVGGTTFEMTGLKNAPVVILVHGLGLSRHAWQWQVPALSERYGVVTYDLYGHGVSPEPPETPSLSLFSRQLAEVLNHLGADKAAVLGFSLGGMIARRFAQDFPRRLWALGVLHSAHTRSKTQHDAIQSRVHQARVEGPQATVEAALVRWFTDDFREHNPATMQLISSWLLANRKDLYAAIYQVLVDGVAEVVAPASPIAVPTLVLTGDEDYGNSPAMSEAIAAEIPRSRLVIMPGLRHMAMAEAPERFNAELIAFLQHASTCNPNSDDRGADHGS